MTLSDRVARSHQIMSINVTGEFINLPATNRPPDNTAVAMTYFQPSVIYETITYDRNGALEYARIYADPETHKFIPAYPENSQNCANFTSQAMYEGGGIPKTSEWKGGYIGLKHHETPGWGYFNDFSLGLDTTRTWDNAKAHHNYFLSKNLRKGYYSGNKENLKWLVEQGIQIGDLLYFTSDGSSSSIYHSTVITNIITKKGEEDIQYSQNTGHHFNRSSKDDWSGGTNFLIITLNDEFEVVYYSPMGGLHNLPYKEIL